MAKVRDHIFNGVYPSLFPCTIPIITIGSIMANKCLKRKLCYSSCIATDIIHHILLCVCRNLIACPFIWFLMLFILLYSIYIACSISYINSDKCYCTMCSWALYVVETPSIRRSLCYRSQKISDGDHCYFSVIIAWTICWASIEVAGDLKHYDTMQCVRCHILEQNWYNIVNKNTCMGHIYFYQH